MITWPTTELPALPCFLNGVFSDISQAKVSVMDRGFIFGDGIYEVAPVYNGRLFRFDQHMDRLERSLREVRIEAPMTRDEWRELALTLVRQQAGPSGPEGKNQLVYLQITRGVAMRDHVMTQGIAPTVFAMANTMKMPTAQQRELGVACVSANDFRWAKAHIKTTSLLGAVFARQISADADTVETVMFRDGFLSEAAASNVWVVKNGVLLGSPKDNLVLEGIRYGLIEQLCQKAGIAFELRRISRAEVLAADELLLTSATKEVLSIATLDGQPVGTGRPGPVYARLYAGYQQAKQEQA